MATTSQLTSNGSGVHCYVCRNLDYRCSLPGADDDVFVGSAFEFASFSRHFSEIEKSADRGCPVCWVLASVRRLWDDSIDTATQLTIDLEADGDVRLSWGSYIRLHLYVPRDKPLSQSRYMPEIFSLTFKDKMLTCLQVLRKKGDLYFNLYRLEESLLPRRVLEVGDNGDERLRLYDTQRGVRGLYIALSYCWGSNKELKTTSANIEGMMSGQLRLSHLPQTLADAVHITRSLGIQYLWVDALCIIQDNVEDWERESEQMATIYEKAYLVIAAASSSSVTEGFLNHQRQERGHRFDIQSICGKQSSVVARKHPRSGFHDPDWITEKTDPLAQRAWAFQEQHLSTRCLIFSTDELQWVCKTKTACECDDTTGTTYYHQLLSVNCDGTQKDDEAGSQLALLDMWHVAVEEYSSRKLTLPDDRFPAFSGLASRFGARIGSRYIAGLWEDNIIQGLMWSRPLGLAPLPIKSRAPSFSWASLDCGVNYYLAIDKTRRWIPCSLVHDVQAIVPGHNPFGKVRDAWVTIQGPMLRGTIRGSQVYPQFCSDDGGINFHVEEDCLLSVFNYATADNGDEISVQRYQCLSPFEDSTREALEYKDVSSSVVDPELLESSKMHSDFAQASVWLLHLARSMANGQTASQSEDVGHSTDFYLVLGKSAHDPQKYERLGCCHPPSTETLDKHSERFITKTITIV